MMQEFVKYSIPVLLFFVIGDTVTTMIGIEHGYVETNPFLQEVVTDWMSLLWVKLLILPALYVVYRVNPSKIYFMIPTVAGVILIINNLYHIYGGYI